MSARDLATVRVPGLGYLGQGRCWQQLHSAQKSHIRHDMARDRASPQFCSGEDPKAELHVVEAVLNGSNIDIVCLIKWHGNYLPLYRG